MLELAQTAEVEQHRLPSGGATGGDAASTLTADAGRQTALVALRRLLEGLDAQTRAKLRTLMHAGRDARDPGENRPAMAEQAEDAAGAWDGFEQGHSSLENLKRGHAIACATSIDLERDIVDWCAPADRRSLDQRVWLRFGRELALSEPEQWRCVGVLGGDRQLERLYLQRGQNAWWSFDALLDRQPPALVNSRKTAAKRRQQTAALVSIPFADIAAQTLHADRRALRRAVLAVSARLGSFALRRAD